MGGRDPAGKGRMIFETEINGLPVKAYFPEPNIEEVYVPLLRHFTALQKKLQRRILVYLAAPPGIGKSTMAAFLREMSRGGPGTVPGVAPLTGVTPITVIGMDGFHRRQEYLLSHTAVRDGREVRMVEIKGAPVTFDLELFRAGIEQAASGQECEWPEYDRLLHDPVYRGQKVTGDIILLEGNYLLLDEDGWRDLKQYADYTVRISADPEMLRERLVSRKAASGMKREDAERFVEFSDLHNARLVLEHSMGADLELRLLADNSYEITGGFV